MRRKDFVIYPVLLVLLFASNSIYAQSESIQNGGFETGNHDPWVYTAGFQMIIPNRVTNSVAYNGEYSLDIGCGLTPCTIQQLLTPSVFATGPLSFWIFVPLDPCGYLGDYCSLNFDLTVQYSGSQEFYNLSSQLTGSGWKKIDIPVSQSDEIQEIIFGVYGTQYLYLDEVSLPGESSEAESEYNFYVIPTQGGGAAVICL